MATDTGQSFFANGPAGSQTIADAQPVTVARDEYTWTETPAVEGFFVALTIVVMPIAAWRWSRRLRLWRAAASRRRAP